MAVAGIASPPTEHMTTETAAIARTPEPTRIRTGTDPTSRQGRAVAEPALSAANARM
jgi:hypothetical protein